MFKIGDFSQMVQVSTRMLRHYDKLGLLQPEMVDHFTGYRYYTLAQIPQLNRILALKDLGFSLNEIGDLLRENVSTAEMRGMLRMRQAEITRTLAEEQQRLARVAARLRQIEQAGEGQMPQYEVVVKQSSPLAVASQRQIVPTLDDMPSYRCTMFDDTYAWLSSSGVKPAGHEMVIYHLDEYVDTDVDMETAVPIPDEAMEELGRYTHADIQLRRMEDGLSLASTIHQGSIYDIPQAITALFAWVQGNDLHSEGAIREVHLSGREDSGTDFNAILFELQVPVRER